jgi:hypothetical protein
MKTLIFTSANAQMETMLLEWVISLRHFGGYEGEVLIMDYGLTDKIIRLLEYFRVRIIKFDPSNSIVNQRYLDIIYWLSSDYPDHLCAHFDADIWFQDDINDLFDMIEVQYHGVLFSPDQTSWIEPYRGREEDIERKTAYEQRVQNIWNQFKGSIQGGFCAGYGKNLARKFSDFKALLDSGFIKMEYGADQFAFNWLFEPSDTAPAYLYNCIGGDTIYSNGAWYTKKYDQKVKAKALHVIGVLRGEVTRHFRNLHGGVFAMKLAEAGYRLGKPAKYLPQWSLPDTPVWARMIGIIETCRSHNNSGIAVGMQQPVFCLNDIGCTGLVSLGHGNEGYWDLHNLLRQPHIQNPDRLYLSANAVSKLGQVKMDDMYDFCRGFPEQYFDLLLSIFCARSGLTIGII